MKAAGPDVLLHTKPSNMFCLTADGRLCAYGKIPQEGKGRAAAILGLTPSTLRARMHKLGIVRPETKESD